VKVLVATRSRDKFREIRTILRGVPGLELVSPDEAGIPPSPQEEDIEIHGTFEENARAKARWFHERSGLPTLADDSGLAVDALGGRPGVHSKRFAPSANRLQGKALDQANNLHLMELLGDTPIAERTGRYVCVAVLRRATGEEVVVRGEAEGLLLGRPKGWGGFGYDPLFYDPRLGKTFAELSPEEKDARSHRGKAFRALVRHLTEPVGEGGA
jgi:XTP/dITP diphosphohydrolase